MKKYFIIIIYLLIIISCNKNKKVENKTTEEFSVPNTYELINSTQGDLDYDGIDELIYVYNSDSSTQNGIIRYLYICKNKNNKITVWKTFSNPILKYNPYSQEKDFFEDILIDNNNIYITHAGGKDTVFYFNHCYSFVNNDFYLTKAIVDYGIPCEKWETYIYDIFNKTITFQTSPDSCDDEINAKQLKIEKKEYKINDNNSYKMKDFIPGNKKVLIQQQNLKINF